MPAPGILLVDRLDQLSDVTPVTVDEQVLARDQDTLRYLGRAVPQTAALAAGGGAGLIGFQQSGVGAVLRTLDAKLKDDVSVKDFAAVGDGVTDDTVAFQNALAAAAPTSTSRGRRVKIPFGIYRLSQSLHISRNVVMVGEAGSGNTAAAASYSGSTLLFDAGVTGIIVDRDSTSPDGGRGDYSSIKDVSVQAASKSGTAHGIQLHARASIEHCWIKNFSGDGIHIVATTPTNANNWHVADSRVEDCSGWGLYVQGNDVNAGYAIGLDMSLCGAGGIHDESFLGNYYAACHVDTAGGPSYETVGSVNRSLFSRCYAEEGQPIGVKIRLPSLILGGNLEFDAASTAPRLDSYTNQAFQVRNALVARNTRAAGIIESHLGFDDTSQSFLAWQLWSGASLVDDIRLSYEAEETGWYSLIRNGLQAQTALAFSGVNAPEGAGQVRFRNGAYFGVGSLRRKVTTASTRPPNGTGQTGDWALNTNPSLGGPGAYVCFFNGSTTIWQDSAILAPFDTAHTWLATQTFNTHMDVRNSGVINWNNVNIAPPNAGNDLVGSRLALFRGVTPDESATLGYDTDYLWANAREGFRVYRRTALLGTWNNAGLTLAAGKALVAPGGATIGNLTGILGATAGVVGLADTSGFLVASGSGFAHVISGGNQPQGDAVWESTSDPAKGSQYWGSTRLKESTGQWGFGTYEIPSGVRAIFEGDVRINGRLLVGAADSQADFLIGSDPEPATTYGTFSIGAGGFGDVGPVFNGPAAGTVFAANHLAAFIAAGGHFINIQQEGTSRWVVRADWKQGYGTADPLEAQHIVGGMLRLDGPGDVLKLPNVTGTPAGLIAVVNCVLADGTPGFIEIKARTAPVHIPADTFDRATDTVLGTSSSTDLWTAQQSSTFGIEGATGLAQPLTLPRAMNVATLAGQVANGAGQVKVKLVKSGGVFANLFGLMLHWASTDGTHGTGYVVFSNSAGTVFLYYWNGTLYRNEADTSGTAIGQSGTGALPDGGEIEVTLGATTIAVAINNVQVIAPVTVGHNLGSALHGIAVDPTGDNQLNARWNDFTGSIA